MIRTRGRAAIAAVTLGIIACAIPALAGPPGAIAEAQPGTWSLIPLPDAKLPAAWVINTQNGDTYLCGPGSHDGQAKVACIEANFPRVPSR